MLHFNIHNNFQDVEHYFGTMERGKRFFINIFKPLSSPFLHCKRRQSIKIKISCELLIEIDYCIQRKEYAQKVEGILLI